MRKVTLWDYDSIESHNIPNQAFNDNQVGLPKVEAMNGLLREATGHTYEAKGKWDGEELEGLVFSCVDSMEVRKDILESMREGMFIETRMGVYHGQIFSIDPTSEEDKEFWMSNYCGDDIIEDKSACGSSLTIGATAQLLSSIASWNGIKYMREEPIPRCLTVSVNPYLIMEL